MRADYLVHDLRLVGFSSPTSFCSYQVIRANDWEVHLPSKTGTICFRPQSHGSWGVFLDLILDYTLVPVSERYCPSRYIIPGTWYVDCLDLEHWRVHPKTRAILFLGNFGKESEKEPIILVTMMWTQEHTVRFNLAPSMWVWLRAAAACSSWSAHSCTAIPPPCDLSVFFSHLSSPSTYTAKLPMMLDLKSDSFFQLY